MPTHLTTEVTEVVTHEPFFQKFNYSIAGSALKDRYIRTDIERLQYTNVEIIKEKVARWEKRILNERYSFNSFDFIRLFEIKDELDCIDYIERVVDKIIEGRSNDLNRLLLLHNAKDDNYEEPTSPSDEHNDEENPTETKKPPRLVMEFLSSKKSLQGKQKRRLFRKAFIDSYEKYTNELKKPDNSDEVKEIEDEVESDLKITWVRKVCELLKINLVYDFKLRVDDYFLRKKNTTYKPGSIKVLLQTEEVVSFVYKYYAERDLKAKKILDIFHIGGDFRLYRGLFWGNVRLTERENKNRKNIKRNFSFRVLKRWIWWIVTFKGAITRRIPFVIHLIFVALTFIWLEPVKPLMAAVFEPLSIGQAPNRDDVLDKLEHSVYITLFIIGIAAFINLCGYIYIRWPKFTFKYGFPIPNWELTRISRRNRVRFQKNMAVDLDYDPAHDDFEWEFDSECDDADVTTLFLHLEEAEEHVDMYTMNKKSSFYAPLKTPHSKQKEE